MHACIQEDNGWRGARDGRTDLEVGLGRRVVVADDLHAVVEVRVGEAAAGLRHQHAPHVVVPRGGVDADGGGAVLRDVGLEQLQVLGVAGVLAGQGAVD